MKTSKCKHIFILFGRPGSGKSTIAEAIVNQRMPYATSNQKMNIQSKQSNEMIPSINTSFHLLHLDLDVCIPEWMKINFTNGIYPTLKQRLDFASICCQYIMTEITTNTDNNHHHDHDHDHDHDQNHLERIVLISFSFVNTDLRDYVQQFFNESKLFTLHWILMDTSQNDANYRIATRKNHFYGSQNISDNESKTMLDDNTSTNTNINEHKDDANDASNTNNANNASNTNDTNDTGVTKVTSDWDFAPVLFDHLRLDGLLPVQENANIVLQHIQQIIKS